MDAKPAYPVAITERADQMISSLTPDGEPNRWAVLAPLSVVQLRSHAPKNTSVYTVSKGAMDGLTRALSNELAPRKIRVNAVKPRVVETKGLDASHFLDEPDVERLREQTPLRRFGKPDGYRSRRRLPRLGKEPLGRTESSLPFPAASADAIAPQPGE